MGVAHRQHGKLADVKEIADTAKRNRVDTQRHYGRVKPPKLVEGIRVVAQGDALLAPSVTKRLIHEFALSAPSRREAPPAVDDLTPRELEVFTLIARGMSNAEIADDLVVSETTVKTHVARVLMKLGVRDRVQAVVLAYESGIVLPGET